MGIAVEVFSSQAKAFVRNLNDVQLVNFTKAISLQMLRGVVFKTRVKTGRARGGWMLDVDVPPAGEIGIDPTGEAAVARGAARLNGLRPFSIVYLGNNVPYILKLNDDLGDKMIERTIAEVNSIFP